MFMRWKLGMATAIDRMREAHASGLRPMRSLSEPSSGLARKATMPLTTTAESAREAGIFNCTTA